MNDFEVVFEPAVEMSEDLFDHVTVVDKEGNELKKYTQIELINIILNKFREDTQY